MNSPATISRKLLRHGLAALPWGVVTAMLVYASSAAAISPRSCRLR